MGWGVGVGVGVGVRVPLVLPHLLRDDRGDEQRWLPCARLIRVRVRGRVRFGPGL